MASYLNSSKVNIFPASLRIYNGQGKYTTEHNLTGIVKSVVDNHSYIISRTLEDSPFRFVINGYYFEVTELPNGNNLWANIRIEDAGEYSRLVKVEDGSTELDNNSFYALSFTTDGEDNNATHSLQLKLNGNICEDNFPKFDPESIGPGNINSDGSHDSISQIWVDGAVHIIEQVGSEGVYRYVDKGIFETSEDGSLGFSQPVYFKDGIPETVNTIFWGNDVPSGPVTIGNVTQPLQKGDIFFGLSQGSAD